MILFGRPLSLRMRLTAWSVSVLACGLIFFGISGYFGLRTYLKQSLQESFASTARVISENYLRLIPAKGDAWALDEIHNAYPAAKTQRLIRLSEAGRIIYQTGTLDHNHSPLDSIPLASTTVPQGAFHRHQVGANTYLVFSRPYSVSGGRTFEIEVAGSLGIMMQTLRSLMRTFLISMPLILLLAALGGHALMKRPLGPLLSLTERADSIGRNALGERLPVLPTGDELQSLAISLNRMIERLEDSLAHNRRFSADASHELRTPLTILRCEVEEMLRCPDVPAQATGNAVSALDEIDRMSRIVESLMDITRLDAGGERMKMRPLDLTALARTTLDQMRLLADAKNIPLDLNAPDELVIVADPFRIKQVLVNLIDNAIKYTPDSDLPTPGRDITLHITTEPEAVVLEVADHGVGMTTEAVPRIFDRFFRAEESRNRSAGGVGLGLAIVKAIVSAHHGIVRAESEPGRGTRMVVELPSSIQAAATQPGQDSSNRGSRDEKTHSEGRFVPASRNYNHANHPAASHPLPNELT